MHLKSLTLRGFKSFASVDDAAVRAGHHLRRRPQRLGQVQRRGRARLGHGRAGRQVAARRQDGGRHLRRHHRRARRSAAPRSSSPSTTPTARCPSTTPRSPSRGSCSATAAASTRSTATPAGCSTSRNCCPTPASAARCTSSSARASSTASCTPAPRAAAPSSRRPPASSSTASARRRRCGSWTRCRPTSTRVQDLTDELRRQLKPLGRQAEVARRAAVIQADLRDARLRLLADDLVTLREALRAGGRRRGRAQGAQGRRRAGAGRRPSSARPRLEAEVRRAGAACSPQAQQTWYELSQLQRARCAASATSPPSGTGNAADAPAEERRGRDPEDMEREAAEVREQEEMLGEAAWRRPRSALDEAVERARRRPRTAPRGEERRLQDAARATADRREGLARLRGQVEALRSKMQAAEARDRPAGRGAGRGRRARARSPRPSTRS